MSYEWQDILLESRTSSKLHYRKFTPKSSFTADKPLGNLHCRKVEPVTKFFAENSHYNIKLYCRKDTLVISFTIEKLHQSQSSQAKYSTSSKIHCQKAASVQHSSPKIHITAASFTAEKPYQWQTLLSKIHTRVKLYCW